MLKIQFLSIPIILIVITYFSVTGYLSKRTDTVIIHSVYATDLNDDKKLVGASNNIFLAEIISDLGTMEDTGGFPLTKYKVKVIKNIKGSFSGEIIITKEGGYKDNQLYISEGDFSYTGSNNEMINNDGLLKTNTIYLLFSILDKESGYNRLISHPNTTKPYIGINKLSAEQALSKDQRIIELKKAYTQEIPFSDFIKEGRNYNAYSTLSESEKEDLLK